MIAEFQAILATTPRNALVVTIWRLYIFWHDDFYCVSSVDMENDNCRPGPQIMEMAHMWRMANDPFVQVETTKRLLFPTDDPPEAITLRLGTEELESELAETPRSILSTTSRHEVNIFSHCLSCLELSMWG